MQIYTYHNVNSNSVNLQHVRIALSLAASGYLIAPGRIGTRTVRQVIRKARA